MSNSDIRTIDYNDMECNNCGNKPLLLCVCEGDPGYVDYSNGEPCAKVCDLWCPLDYFDYDDHYPEFEVINQPVEG